MKRKTDKPFGTVKKQRLVKRLLAWRKRHGRTQEYVAHALGTGQDEVSHWENGKHLPSNMAAVAIEGLIK